MDLKKINSLVELLFKKFDEKFSNVSEKSHEEIFLISLKNKEFSNTNFKSHTYSWGNIETKIKVLSKKVLVKECLANIFLVNNLVWSKIFWPNNFLAKHKKNGQNKICQFF